MPQLSIAVTVTPARRLRGRLRVPGDKSISHRYALLAALAEGQSTLAQLRPRRRLPVDAGLPAAAGRRGRARALPAPLPYWDEVRADSVRRPGALDAGNSGTTMRLLAGVLAGQPFSSTLIGDASLSRRPMRRVIEPLERMGARIEATDGHPPLTHSRRDACTPLRTGRRCRAPR